MVFIFHSESIQRERNFLIGNGKRCMVVFVTSHTSKTQDLFSISLNKREHDFMSFKGGKIQPMVIKED